MGCTLSPISLGTTRQMLYHNQLCASDDVTHGSMSELIGDLYRPLLSESTTC